MEGLKQINSIEFVALHISVTALNVNNVVFNKKSVILTSILLLVSMLYKNTEQNFRSFSTIVS